MSITCLGAAGPPPPPPHPDDLIGVVFDTLVALPRSNLSLLVVMLSIWLGLPWKRRALLLKILIPHLPDRLVAAASGVDRTTVLRWPCYKRLKVLLKLPEAEIMGIVDEAGGLDAWLARDV